MILQRSLSTKLFRDKFKYSKDLLLARASTISGTDLDPKKLLPKFLEKVKTVKTKTLLSKTYQIH